MAKMKQKQMKEREDKVIDDGMETEYTGPSKQSEDTADMEMTPEVGMEEEISAKNEAAKNVITVSPTELPVLEGRQAGDSVNFQVFATVDRINDDGTMDLSIDSMESIAETASEMVPPPTQDMGMGPAPEAGAGMGGLASLLGGK